jgi:hypothetical protein
VYLPIGTSDTKMNHNFEDTLTTDPLSVYVPLESLTEQVIHSVISVALQPHDYSGNFSQRTLRIFLLAIDEKLKEIEKGTDKQFDEQAIQHAEKVRQWLVDGNNKPLHWDKLREEYDRLAEKKCDDSGTNHQSKDVNRYSELKEKTVSTLIL